MSVPQRPNIVMIMADQLPAFPIGTYGHPLVQTPAMERAVMESQQTRLIIKDAMAKGRSTSWDYRPVFDGSKQYVREKDSQETNMLMRIPKQKGK